MGSAGGVETSRMSARNRATCPLQRHCAGESPQTGSWSDQVINLAVLRQFRGGRREAVQIRAFVSPFVPPQPQSMERSAFARRQMRVEQRLVLHQFAARRGVDDGAAIENDRLV